MKLETQKVWEKQSVTQDHNGVSRFPELILLQLRNIFLIFQGQFIVHTVRVRISGNKVVVIQNN